MNNEDTVQAATTGAPGPTTYMWLWSARVRVKESQLDRSFQVLIFVGSVPDDPRKWMSAPSYAGAFSAFVSSGQVQGDVVTEGSVHLNHALTKNEGVHTFDPQDVRPCLKKDLDWRVEKADGTPVPLERLPSLEVMVVAIQLAMRAGELPVPVGEPVLHRDITSGRLGGARPE